MQIPFLHLFEQQSSSSLQLPFIRLQVGLFVHCSLLYDRWQNPVQHPAKFLQPSPNFLHIPKIEYHLLYSALIFWLILGLKMDTKLLQRKYSACTLTLFSTFVYMHTWSFFRGAVFRIFCTKFEFFSQTKGVIKIHTILVVEACCPCFFQRCIFLFVYVLFIATHCVVFSIEWIFDCNQNVQNANHANIK